LQAAQRQVRDVAPGAQAEEKDALAGAHEMWRERWKGLRGWFVTTGHDPPQAEVLRSKARSAIPHLLAVIAALNERRSGRSDRSADFRTLACWFAECRENQEAHCLARAAFALNAARHFLAEEDMPDLPATTSWADAPSIQIHPRLRQYGEIAPRGPLPRVRDRTVDRAELAAKLAQTDREIAQARAKLANGKAKRLSELGPLDSHGFQLFLDLLSEALPAQASPDETVERQTGDGLLRIRLEPLGANSNAEIPTETGVFAGRDHLLTVTPTEMT
jgi:uncharacterized protein (TIGR02677 family)